MTPPNRSPRACSICGGAQSRRLLADINRRDGIAAAGEYRECATCGHIFLSPVPTPEELKEYYRAAAFSGTGESRSNDAGKVSLFARGVGFAEHRLLEKRSRRYHEAHRYLPPAAGDAPRLLDMGCGDGATLQKFQGRGWEICGVDISAAAIQEARGKVPEATLQVSDLEETVLELGRFDLVRLDNVLEHVLNPEAVVRAARNYLREGGALAIYVPHGRSLSMRLLRSRSVSHWVPFHLNLFTAASLTALLERAGFASVRVDYLDPSSWWTLTMAQAVNPAVRLTEVGPRIAQSPGLRALALPFRLLSPLSGGEELFALARLKKEEPQL